MLNPGALQWKVSPSTLMQHKPAFALMTLFSHAPVNADGGRCVFSTVLG